MDEAQASVSTTSVKADLHVTSRPRLEGMDAAQETAKTLEDFTKDTMIVKQSVQTSTMNIPVKKEQHTGVRTLCNCANMYADQSAS